MEAKQILLVDDQTDVLRALRLLLKSEGYPCALAQAPGEAVRHVRNTNFAAALIDLNYASDTTSGREGLRLLEELRTIDPDLPMIVMTAWGSIGLAVEAMRAGASDFIEKPWDNRHLLGLLRTHVALGIRRREKPAHKRLGPAVEPGPDAAFVAKSPAMQALARTIDRVAGTDANILLLGENGVGKGLVAARIHGHSTRANKSMVTVNMGSIAESVFESEMFGHVKGAFTDARSDRVGRFELASGGTLFMDEIGNIPPTQQPKLLRVIEDGQYEALGSSSTRTTDVRVISATNADLYAEVQAGRFRQDLLYRLNTLELRIPPLRERTEDIRPLAELFMKTSGLRYGKDGMRIAPTAMQALENHEWPGNVRELSHVMERAAIIASGHVIDLECLALVASTIAIEGAAPAVPRASRTLRDSEDRIIRSALGNNAGNIQRTAAELGLSRAALYRRMEKYGIVAGDFAARRTQR